MRKLIALACVAQAALMAHAFAQAASSYAFEKGYPSEQAAKHAYDDADFQRAITAYGFSYLSGSVEGIFNGNRVAVIEDNTGMGIAAAGPKHMGFTLNSDTPYGSATLDLSQGPMVIELPAGASIGLVDGQHQGWVQDLGLPGPGAGKGGKHLVPPPSYRGEVPSSYFVGHSLSNQVLLAVRAIPVNADVPKATDALRTINIYSRSQAAKPTNIAFVDTTNTEMDGTSLT